MASVGKMTIFADPPLLDALKQIGGALKESNSKQDKIIELLEATLLAVKRCDPDPFS